MHWMVKIPAELYGMVHIKKDVFQREKNVYANFIYTLNLECENGKWTLAILST